MKKLQPDEKKQATSLSKVDAAAEEMKANDEKKAVEDAQPAETE